MPIVNYLFIEAEDEIRAAAARQREDLFAARARAMTAPKPPEPWQHLSDATKEQVKAKYAKWTAYRRGELGPSDRIQSQIDAQQLLDRQNYSRMVSLGIAPRGMDGRTPVSSRSGLPEWVLDATSLFFHPESGDLCKPYDWPTGVGGKPADWYGKPFTKPFELKGGRDPSSEDFDRDLGRIVWRPGEHRWLPSPDAELPEP
jgi:hypothetical protein